MEVERGVPCSVMSGRRRDGRCFRLVYLVILPGREALTSSLTTFYQDKATAV